MPAFHVCAWRELSRLHRPAFQPSPEREVALMSAPNCPFPGASTYLSRTPEKLVVNGVRLWADGYEKGDITSWEMAWNLYAAALGPVQPGPR
jgi:hypothetical protein